MSILREEIAAATAARLERGRIALRIESLKAEEKIERERVQAEALKRLIHMEGIDRVRAAASRLGVDIGEDK